MTWPDLSLDSHAMDLAQAALGPDASVQQLVIRAQEIKDAVKRGEIVILREDFQSFVNCLLVDSGDEPEDEYERRLR